MTGPRWGASRGSLLQREPRLEAREVRRGGGGERGQHEQCRQLLERIGNGQGALCSFRMSVYGLGKLDMYQWLYFLCQHGRWHLEFLAQRLRLRGSCQREIENVSFPFLFASGSEMLRTYILGESEFTSSLPDRYRLPDRGFIWYLFSQSVKEIQVMPEKIVIKYELLEEYRKPFRQFYL